MILRLQGPLTASPACRCYLQAVQLRTIFPLSKVRPGTLEPLDEDGSSGAWVGCLLCDKDEAEELGYGYKDFKVIRRCARSL